MMKICALTILLLFLTACEVPGVVSAPAIPTPCSSLCPESPLETQQQVPHTTEQVEPGPTPKAKATSSSAPSPTAQANCVDNAMFLADVTISDNTRLKAGESFTKTWQLRNTGNCAWNASYTLVFTGGNRMNSPDSVALADTAPNATLDLSVDLKAPATDGVYTALYEIHNPQGKAIPIGLTKSMWVKIMVGNPILMAQATEITTSGEPNPTAGPTSDPKGPCKPEQVTTELIGLINAARASAGLRRLNANAQLAASAQRHSDDMACHNQFSHTGSDGSSTQDRILAAGYSPSNWGEIIFAGGSAQQAFDWWMSDPPHRDIILAPQMEDLGVGYTYVAGSAYGGYFTVDFGAQ